jgi:hypothetical protein
VTFLDPFLAHYNAERIHTRIGTTPVNRVSPTSWSSTSSPRRVRKKSVTGLIQPTLTNHRFPVLARMSALPNVAQLPLRCSSCTTASRRIRHRTTDDGGPPTRDGRRRRVRLVSLVSCPWREAGPRPVKVVRGPLSTRRSAARRHPCCAGSCGGSPPRAPSRCPARTRTTVPRPRGRAATTAGDRSRGRSR